jgi:hypothetical protein
MQPASRPSFSAALPKLFARYVTGQITEPSWRNLMTLFDADTVTAQERMALAKFFNDLVEEVGPQALFAPRLEEAVALLVDTRH